MNLPIKIILIALLFGLISCAKEEEMNVNSLIPDINSLINGKWEVTALEKTNGEGTDIYGDYTFSIKSWDFDGYITFYNGISESDYGYSYKKSSKERYDYSLQVHRRSKIFDYKILPENKLETNLFENTNKIYKVSNVSDSTLTLSASFDKKYDWSGEERFDFIVSLKRK